MSTKICVTSYWYYRKWWHRLLFVKHVNHDCFPMEWRKTPIRALNKWVLPTKDKNKE